MKRYMFAIAICASLGIAAGAAQARDPQAHASPSPAEVQQNALQDGPATPQLGYLTHRDPVTQNAAGPPNPKLMRPLTQRELGMLLNACVAYPECVTEYSQAYERYQAQQRAQAGAAKPGN